MKKENQIFLTYKEIQKGSVAYIGSPSSYDFATDPIWISLHMRKNSFSFLSVQGRSMKEQKHKEPSWEEDKNKAIIKKQAVFGLF